MNVVTIPALYVFAWHGRQWPANAEMKKTVLFSVSCVLYLVICISRKSYFDCKSSFFFIQRSEIGSRNVDDNIVIAPSGIALYIYRYNLVV